MFVDAENIRLMITGGSIVIGELSSLYALEPYQNGAYETENGFVIDIEQFIDSMIVSEDSMQSIKRAPKNNVSVDEGVSQRLHRFHTVLLKRLRGELRPR